MSDWIYRQGTVGKWFWRTFVSDLAWYKRQWRYWFGPSPSDVLYGLYAELAADDELPDGCDPDKEIRRILTK